MRTALLGLVFVVAAGCKVKNPNFCEGNDNQLCTDGGIPPEKCSATDPCDVGVCKEPPGTCVECTPTQDDACSGTKPFCDETANNTCRGCKAHTECPDSNACLPDGRCADASEVAYVKNMGMGATCSKAMPCGDVATALAVAKAIIRIEGTITEPTTIALNNRSVTMLGDSTSILQRTGGDVISVDGNSVLKLYDLTITGAVGNTGINALNSHTGTLELQRCKVTNNSLGILYAGTGTFILSRSTIAENLLTGGVSVTGNAKLEITNNFIVRNGNNTNGIIGGISLTAGVPGMSRIEFNTIVQNQNTDANSRAGGIYCDISTAFTMPNNLIAGNVAPNATRAQVNGDCLPTGSLVQADLTGFMFVNPAASPYDYHLKQGTTGGINTAAGTLMFDVDGQTRPNGSGPDMGADELY